MSFSTTSVLQMHFFTDANALEYLKKNLETDEDFNGNNGDEYLHPCAKGFNSNQDYYLTKAFKKNKVPMAINKFFSSLRKDCFYEDIDYILNPASDGYALSVMYVKN